MEEVLHSVLCMSQATAGLISYPTEAAKKKGNAKIKKKTPDNKASFI